MSRTFHASPLVFVALFAAFAVGVLARPAIASAWYGLRSADAPEARPNAEFADADMLELARVQQQWGATGDIVMLGDSITAMGQWSEMFPAADILNRGLGGDTVADIAARAFDLGLVGSGIVQQRLQLQLALLDLHLDIADLLPQRGDPSLG